MKLSTSISTLFQDLRIDEKTVKKIIGSPITYDDKIVGHIYNMNIKNDVVYINIEDEYQSELCKAYPYCDFRTSKD